MIALCTDPEITISNKCLAEQTTLNMAERKWLLRALFDTANNMPEKEACSYCLKVCRMDDEKLMQEGKDRGVI